MIIKEKSSILIVRIEGGSMSGYMASLNKSSVESVLDGLIEQFHEKNLFQDVLKDEEFQLQLKEMIFSAIEEQQLRISALRDEDFAKDLILGFISIYIVKKYNENHPDMPQLDLTVLFKKEAEEDPEAYQELLAKLLKVILLERNKLLPPEKQLSERDIDLKVQALLKSNDPKQAFINMLSLLASEKIIKFQASLEENPEEKLESEDPEKRNISLPRPQPKGVLGVTDVPLEDLEITDLSGQITAEQGLPVNLLSSQHVSEIEANAGKLDFFDQLTDMAKEVSVSFANNPHLTR